MTLDQAIKKAAWLLTYGATREEVRAVLLPSLGDEGAVFLAYHAGVILAGTPS